MSALETAVSTFIKHIGLRTTADDRIFRKTVREELIAVLPCSDSAASTHYNNAFKRVKESNPELVEGLGRQGVSKGARKVSTTKPGPKVKAELVPETECFTVLEIVADGKVGRTHSYLDRSEAVDAFVGKKDTWKGSIWILMQGMGPNGGERFELEEGEEEIDRYTPAQE